MDREIKFADLSDAFDPIGMSCSEIMDEQNSQNESFFIPKITVDNSDNEQKEAKEIKEIKEMKKQEIKSKSQLIEAPGQVKSFLIGKKRDDPSDSDDKTNENIVPKSPLPVFDCMFCVNDYVVFRKITDDYFKLKYAYPQIEAKALEMSFLGKDKRKTNRKMYINSLEMSKNFIINISKILRKKCSPTILKLVCSTKLKLISNIQNKLDLEKINNEDNKVKQRIGENRFNSNSMRYNNESDKADEKEEISELQSEMSLVRVRKSKKPELDISYESEVHNIYDPNFSSTQSSFIDQKSEISSFINLESVFDYNSPNSNKDKLIQNFNVNQKSNIPEVKLLSNKIDDIYGQKEIFKQDNPNILLRHHSDKHNELFEPSLEYLLKNEECQSNRNSYTRYLSKTNKNNVKNTMKETINSICFEMKDSLTHRNSHNSNVSGKAEQSQNKNKEITKISFSNEIKNTYQIMSPKDLKDKIRQIVHISKENASGVHRSLFQNNSALKSMNFDQYSKENGSIIRDRYFDKNLKKTNKDDVIYDKNQINNINLRKDMKVIDNGMSDDQVPFESNSNIPFDFYNSYENENSKFAPIVVKQHSSIEKSDSNIDSKEIKNNSNINDFILKSMNSLKNLQKSIAESSNLSKLKDETLKSIDGPYSPDLGKTKDTSALSGSKFHNKINSDKTYASINNSSSLLGGIGMNSKIIGESELKLLNIFPTKLISHQSLNLKDQNPKSKYLSDTTKIIENNQQSFADKIEALKEKEINREKLLMETAKFGKIPKPNKVSTMSQIAKCHTSRAYQDYSCTSRKTNTANHSNKNHCNCKSREPSIKSGNSRYSK